jgi:predicted RNase H-like HicB family nuclease
VIANVNDRQLQYLVIVEKGETGYGAYVPDLPGCIAAADSRDEVVALIRDAIRLHIEELTADGEPIPEPVSQGELVDVQAA